MDEIEEEVTAELKPQLRMLSLYERYINEESGGAYTDTIGIIEKAKDLPPEYDTVMRKAIFGTKTAGDVFRDDELR